MTFLADTRYTQNLLLNTLFYQLSVALQELLAYWNTTATWANGFELPVYDGITLSGHSQNFQLTLEYWVSKISDKGILGMVFQTEQKLTQCLGNDVLV